MPSIVRTFTTRIDSHPALDARATLEFRIERKLLAALGGGRKFTGDFVVSFYQQFGISAKTLEGVDLHAARRDHLQHHGPAKKMARRSGPS